VSVSEYNCARVAVTLNQSVKSRVVSAAPYKFYVIKT